MNKYQEAKRKRFDNISHGRDKMAVVAEVELR
jgi:hypothetical protein